MKLYLFGGAEVELGQVEPELKLIEGVIKSLPVKQILHIPFARTTATETEWSGDWIHRYMELGNLQYLNAENEEDIAKAKSPLIFISGGSNSPRLIEKTIGDHRLMKLISNSPYIIGEAAGSKALGEYLRSKGNNPESSIISGLGIIKDTIIEPHYTERGRQELLTQSMEKSNAHIGVGIDAMTAIAFELNEFPKKYETIGLGKVVVKTR